MRSPKIIVLLCLIFSGVGFAFSQEINQKDAEGRRQGKWVLYGKDFPHKNYPANLKIEEGVFLNDYKHGVWVKYHTDGKTPRIEGTYVHNRPNGPFTRYYKNGNPKEKGNYYKNDYKGEYWTFYENGEIEHYNPCGKNYLDCDTIYYYHENGCLEHKDFKVNRVLTRSIVFSKVRCGVAVDTVSDYDGWSDLYDWNLDTIDYVQKERLSYPLTKEALTDAFLADSAEKISAATKNFWLVVATERNGIELLIEMLNDNTESKVKENCGGRFLTVGELSYLALNEIAEFSVVSLENGHNQFLDRCGGLDERWRTPENNANLQRILNEFYETYSDQLRFQEFQGESAKESYKKKYGVRGKYVLTSRTSNQERSGASQ